MLFRSLFGLRIIPLGSVRKVHISVCGRLPNRSSSMGDFGSGVGKGGGAGGSIREGGGAFGKMEAAREEQYFRKMTQESIKDLKLHLDEEVGHHEREIQRHLDMIQKHKQRKEQLSVEYKNLKK